MKGYISGYSSKTKPVMQKNRIKMGEKTKKPVGKKINAVSQLSSEEHVSQSATVPYHCCIQLTYILKAKLFIIRHNAREYTCDTWWRFKKIKHKQSKNTKICLHGRLIDDSLAARQSSTQFGQEPSCVNVLNLDGLKDAV